MSVEIHPTAIIDPKAVIADGVEIGPYCIIRGEVSIGTGTKLSSHVVIEGPTKIGQRNLFYDFATIGNKSQDLKYTGEPTYCEIGDDNTFREFVTVHRGTAPQEKTIVGSRNLLLANVHIAHNCELGNEIIISNLGSMAGHVIVEDRCVIGGMAAIHQFSRIGTMSMIGGCAKVVQDVPPYMLVDGAPAEVRTPNKIGLERRGVSAESINALKNAYRILFRQRDKTQSEALEMIENQCEQTTEIKHLLSFIRNSKRGICH
ncbi:MAG: acyl-ACP--UDP-N-acetylglucosamine O-acyltransferase [Verrucomicrobiota bacterium]|nr:acyl-ACP--UDP-N-acetylglucosamine O-acyltransferase [Verrucomicrobiota bacterium]